MATYYKAKVFYPEVYDTWEIELDEKEYAEYRKAVDAAMASGNTHAGIRFQV